MYTRPNQDSHKVSQLSIYIILDQYNDEIPEPSIYTIPNQSTYKIYELNTYILLTRVSMRYLNNISIWY